MKRIFLLIVITSSSIFSQEEVDYTFKNDIYSKSLKELRILRNEIFARKGYNFKNAELFDYFSKFDWYKNTELTTKVTLSKSEKSKVNFIRKVENEKKLNKSRIEVLELLTKIPNESMDSWEWNKEDRYEYLINCQKEGYLINDNSGIIQKRFLNDNHLKIQVVDGSWEILTIPIKEKGYFILTADIVGDGHFFKCYKHDNLNGIYQLDLEDVFPKNWYLDFIPGNSDCENDRNPFALNFDISKEGIAVKNLYEDECLLKKELVFKFNTAKVKYDLIK